MLITTVPCVFLVWVSGRGEKRMEGKALDSRVGCEVNKCLGSAYSGYKEVQEPWPVVQRSTL